VPKIIELSENLANQIAAGEVIERPASVVKELIENAIDAQSTQIVLTVEESGLKKIEINDNGVGIEQADVLAAFKRHATSKIKNQDDLFRIRTLGFRGEALPSIASVSEIYMETASTSEAAGTQITLKGSELVKQAPFAKRRGTKISVTNLFYNTPARLKYIKSLQAELAHISDVINRLSLAHPNIAFTLISDGRQLIKTAGSGDLKQAIAGIYGISTAKRTIEVTGSDLDFTLSGFISLPEVTRASKNYITILVNGRYIKNFLINRALIEGYGSKLMIGRFPLAVLNIMIDPLLIDVNVHPTKQEVRLSKEKELMDLIKTAVFNALKDERLIPSAYDNLTQGTKSIREVSEQLELTLKSYPKQERLAADEPFSIAESKMIFSKVDNPENLASQAIVPPVITPLNQDTSVTCSEHPALDFSDNGKRELKNAWERLASEEARSFPTLEYFGQMRGTYLFAQSSDGLYIIDQHAAQERIKYEYYREKIGDVDESQQTLLIPIILAYSVSDFIKINENLAALQAVGVLLSAYGESSFILRSHPAWFPRGEEEDTIRQLIELLLVTGHVSVKELRAETAIMMSCKRSIKANHHLEEFEARQLLADLSLCQNPYNCPHGRPVLIHFSPSEMEKMFKRIQDPHRRGIDDE
jgi:DNA mismatch repair protein MutL